MIHAAAASSKDTTMYLANVKTRRKTNRKRSNRFKAKLKAKNKRRHKQLQS